MPHFYITARNPQGKQETLLAEGETGGDAVRSLREQGFTELALHTDEIAAATQSLFSEVTNGKAPEKLVPAADYVSFMKMTRFGYFVYLLAKLTGKRLAFYLIILGFFTYRRLYSDRFETWDFLQLFFLVLPFVMAFHGAFFSSRSLYNQILYYATWYRWDEVLKLLPKLKGKIPTFELAVREAGARSGQGDFDEAIRMLEPFSRDASVPEWMYWCRLAEVCYPAGRADKLLEFNRRAFELAPDNNALRIDLAISLIRFERDFPAARELLAEVDVDGLPELAIPYFLIASGLIALEDRRTNQALENFESALAIIEKFAPDNPFAAATVDACHAYLCLAQAQQGDLDTAEKHFKLAEPRLRVYTFKDILQRCHSALGYRTL